MRFQQSKVAIAVGCVVGAGAMTGFGASVALGADIRVDVTGSNIKRVEGEGALPVQTITREDIQATGVQSTLELIDRVAANQSFGSFNPATGEGSNAVGFSAASLRGLGTARTLVLINGKRIAPYALGTSNNYSGVDLSQIPLSAVQRIEILKDGASAIYGTDAIAGVINVILRNDFSGVEVGGQYLDSEAGGGGQRNAHIVLGYGDLAKDSFNAFVAFDWQQQLSLRASDREVSRTSFLPQFGVNRTSGNTIPANLTIPGVGGTKNPGFPGCLPPFSFPTPGFSPGQCRFDYAATIDTIPPSDKSNVLGRLTWQLNPATQLFYEGGYFRGDYLQRVSPTPVSGAFTVNPVDLQPGTTYYPTQYIIGQGGDPTLPVGLSYRALEFGPRSDQVKVEQYRSVAGVVGNIGGRWDYAVDVNYTANKEQDSYVGGYLSEVAFVPLLTNGTINPFGFSTPAGFAAGNAAQIRGVASSNKASNYGANAKISGDVYRLPAGPVAMAFGTEWRREKLELHNSDFLSSGDIIGGSGAIPSLSSSSRSVFAAFFELNVPIVANLEGNVAVRYDHYSDVGSTTNPKFTLRWQPTRELLLRAAYGTGFRAPTLFDLFQPGYRTNTNNSFSDPLRCDVTGGVNDCDLQYNSQRGGNNALKPERSTQYYVGGVWEPASKWTDGLSIGVDYYWIEIKDVIQQVVADSIFQNFSQFAGQVVPAPGYNGATYVVRKPGVDPNYPGLPNEIAYVVEPTLNLGKNGVDGIDFDLRYRMPAPVWPTTWGRLNARLNGSYILHYKQTQAADNSYPNLVGTGQPPQGAVSRYRHYATLDWLYGPWGVTLAQTYQHGYSEPDFLSDDPNARRRVGAYEVYDIQARYGGFKNVELALGIRNILDRAPPQVANVGTFQIGYDPSYGDPRGRMYYGTISVAFK